jgi:hypothetical protein
MTGIQAFGNASLAVDGQSGVATARDPPDLPQRVVAGLLAAMVG